MKKESKTKKIAILAAGGNSPGMNNAIITLVKKAISEKMEPYLIYNGYDGILKQDICLADPRKLEEFNARGNVIIGSGRSKTFYDLKIKKQASDMLKNIGIDVLICIGGDGTYTGAYHLSKLGTKVICLPATIDNDVASTESTIGFSTCMNSIVDSLDAIRDSFDSHSGICFVEVMGRHFSDLAIFAGIAIEAEAIVTEDNIMKTEEFVDIANATWKTGKRSCIFIITENIYGIDKNPSLIAIAKKVEKETGRVVRVNVLGHLQRGGTPSAFDRHLASRMANHAINCITKGKLNRAISSVHREIIDIQIEKAIKMPKKKNNIHLAKEYALINRV